MKTVCVIGAGASGLTAIKCCLDEGLEPTCFERSDHIAGLWHYTPNPKDGHIRVIKSTITNTSKEMSSYSDFPAPKVVSVQKSDDFSISGKWDVRFRKMTSEDIQEKTFDAVLVCTGPYTEVKMPSFPGMEKFKGRMIHSQKYTDYLGYEDKRVVVVGVGNTGVDIAVELSRITSQVYLSTRRGAWVQNRIVEDGKPLDMAKLTRFAALCRDLFPNQNNKIMRKYLNKRFNHKIYCLEPAHEPSEARATFSAELPSRIAYGAINIKTDIKEITENGVVFRDGSTADNIDVIILATGYMVKFPFLDKSIIKPEDNRLDLHKHMFQPDLERQTLAVIGVVQPHGPLMPISEMQCRLASRIFKGLVKLPSRQTMLEDVLREKQKERKNFVNTSRNKLAVDYVMYMDELAKLIGCKPNIGKLLLTDPQLAWKCFFDAATPYQYRLMGPGSWSGARDAIMNHWARTFHPLQTRPVPVMSGSQTNLGTMVAVVAVILAVVMYYVVVR